VTHLNTKERYLLEDQKSHEEICIKKYGSYANQAQDPQLKQLFSDHGRHEQQHYNTINQILSGQVPNMSQQQGQQQQQQMQQQAQQQNQPPQSRQQSQLNPNHIQVGITSQNDADLCSDMLSTEKYVSSTYDTAIFEFTDHNIRNALNHIQKEEQEHGEAIFAYMQSKGMYNPPQ